MPMIHVYILCVLYCKFFVAFGHLGGNKAWVAPGVVRGGVVGRDGDVGMLVYWR